MSLRHRQIRHIALIAGAVAALTWAASGAGSAAASTVPREFYGVSPNTPLVPDDFDRMAAANVGSLRISIGRQSIQNGSQFDWDGTDVIVALAASHGISLVPDLGEGAVPKPNGSWTAFLKAFAQRYGPSGVFWLEHPLYPKIPITRWQIANEQNSPKRRESPTKYAHLVEASSGAIKSIDPNAQIVLGGMFGTPPGRPKDYAWNYLKGLYKAGAGPSFDAVSIHPYAETMGGIGRQVKQMRAVMDAHHDSAKPILITEIGWGSGKPRHGGGRGNAFVVGSKQQAANLTTAYKMFVSHRTSWGLGGVFWFSWKDPANPPKGLCAFCYSSGLYKADGKTAKPALAAFKAFTSLAG